MFYNHERVVSSDCLKLGEMLELIKKGYPGAQVLRIETTEAPPKTKQSQQRSGQKIASYEEAVYCDPISVT